VTSPYLTTAEAAEFLRVSVRTVRERTRRREIPFRIGAGTRGCLFLEAELLDWLNGDYDGLDVRELPQGGVSVRLLGHNGAMRKNGTEHA
jgi:excisionase family DNA binding protein